MKNPDKQPMSIAAIVWRASLISLILILGSGGALILDGADGVFNNEETLESAVKIFIGLNLAGHGAMIISNLAQHGRK